MSDFPKNYFRAFTADKSKNLTPKQKIMMENIRQLSEKEASDIMTPRTDVISFELGSPLPSVLNLIQKYGYSRYPIWHENIDNIVGVLYVKDLLYYLINRISDEPMESLSLDESLLREAYFIPETKSPESLLGYFQLHKVHFANVLDEYGGFSGIVSLEDVIELVAGDIQDEYDQEEEEIYKMSSNVYIVDGRTSLQSLEEQTPLDFTPYKEEVDTIGGLIYMILGKTPTLGEHIEIKGAHYQVIKQEQNKILAVKILLSPNKN